VDFHGLRQQNESQVVASGTSVKVCQQLARHSTPLLTLGQYAHVRLANLRKAVPTLPTTTPGSEPMVLRITGTDYDDLLPPETRAPPMHQIERENGRMGANRCDAWEG
jgi:hypothetical protein